MAEAGWIRNLLGFRLGVDRQLLGSEKNRFNDWSESSISDFSNRPVRLNKEHTRGCSLIHRQNVISRTKSIILWSYRRIFGTMGFALQRDWCRVIFGTWGPGLKMLILRVWIFWIQRYFYLNPISKGNFSSFANCRNYGWKSFCSKFQRSNQWEFSVKNCDHL